MKKILMSLLLSIAALLLPAGPVVDGNGNLQIGKLALRWTCYAPDWSAAVLGNDSFKAAPGFPRYNSGEFETAARSTACNSSWTDEPSPSKATSRC